MAVRESYLAASHSLPQLHLGSFETNRASFCELLGRTEKVPSGRLVCSPPPSSSPPPLCGFHGLVMGSAPPTPANPPGIPAIKDPGTLLPSAFDSRAAEGMISHRTHITRELRRPRVKLSIRGTLPVRKAIAKFGSRRVGGGGRLERASFHTPFATWEKPHQQYLVSSGHVRLDIALLAQPSHERGRDLRLVSRRAQLETENQGEQAC